MILSKSKYTKYCQCPKLLWMDIYKPECQVVDPTLQQRFDAGTQVGDLARSLFGEYVDTTTYTAEGKLDISAMIAKTQQLLKSGTANICEASFSHGNSYCAVDILRKTTDGYAIYEVKSSTKVSEVYLWDVAYQKYTLEQCGINVTASYVVHINNKYVKNGEIDIHQLFNIVDVSSDIVPYYQMVADNVKQAQTYLMQTQEPTCQIGEQCSYPYECPYFSHCVGELPQPNIFDIYRIGQKKYDLFNQGIKSFDDVVKAGVKLTTAQQRQIDYQRNNLPDYVDKKGVKEFLDKLHYPLYFFDFETFASPIPLCDGTRPYQQVPFQYSLHYIQSGGQAVEHSEFLAQNPLNAPNELVEQLINDIPANACVLVYNKSFEQGRLKELAQMFPQYSSQLMAIHDNIVDLMDVFSKGLVYNRAMGGSFSIKSVLPAMFPNDATLDYHNLQDVHNGSEASSMYLQLSSLTKTEQAKLRENLLKYCELDTFAMVKLWQKLVELVK